MYTQKVLTLQRFRLNLGAVLLGLSDLARIGPVNASDERVECVKSYQEIGVLMKSEWSS